MRMLIDKQSKEMAFMAREKRELEDQVTVLEEELDRIVAAVENSSANISGLANSQLIMSSRSHIDERARRGKEASRITYRGSLPQRTAAGGPLRRNRELYSNGAAGEEQNTGNLGVFRGKSIASPSLANTIAANAALLALSPSRSPSIKEYRSILQRLANAIPETDEHPVVGYMPSPTPRMRQNTVTS